MADVMLFQSQDGGEVEIVGGVVTLDETPFSAVYISLWGGQIEDNGTSATKAKSWWGNADEPDLDRHIRSKTQALLTSLAATTGNLLRVEEAALADLEWMRAEIADEVTAVASLPARNTVRLQIRILGRNGTPYQFDFTRPWGPSTS